jgi:hypothetical protein
MGNNKTLRITTSTGDGDSYGGPPPKGAKILRQSVSTTTEPIENGFLVTKSYDGRYSTSSDKEGNDHYFSYSKKWFSKEDPLTITVNDEELADVFPEDE